MSAIIRSKKLVHLFHLGWFKLTKFVETKPDLADCNDGSTQSTAPQSIVSSEEESVHVPGLMCDHNNSTLVLSRVNNNTIKKRLTRRVVLRLV